MYFNNEEDFSNHTFENDLDNTFNVSLPWENDLNFLIDEDLFEFNEVQLPWYQDLEFLNDLKNLDQFSLDYVEDLFGGFDFAHKPKISERFNYKWKAEEKSYDFTLKNIEFKNFFEANNQIRLFFEKIFDEYIMNINGENFVRLVMDHDLFGKAINTPFMKRKEMSASMMLEQFSSVFQSRTPSKVEDRQDTHSFKLVVKVLPKYIVTGGCNDSPTRKRGRPFSNIPKRVCKEKKEIIDMNDFCEQSRFVQIVKNSDNFCLLRAFFIGKAFSDKDSNAKNLNRKNNRKLNQLVNEFVEKMKIPDIHLDLRYCQILEDYFQNYQITVYDTIENDSVILYPLDERRSQLKDRKFTNFVRIVYHNNNHFNLILSPNSYFGNSYFCEYCRFKYSNLYKNNCSHVCSSCKRAEYKCIEVSKKKCKNCEVFFRNDSCQKLHNSSICKRLTKCDDCGFSKSRFGGHVCKQNEKWCPNCKESVDVKHKCFIKKDSSKKVKKVNGKIFFDIESFENKQGFH